MNRTHFFGLMVLLVISAFALFGCQQRPAVPTTAPEATEPVVVVVVTATSQPTLAPSITPEPTITTLPTLTPVVTQTVTGTVKAGTPVAAATRPAATKPAAQQPTAVAQQPTTSAPPTTSAQTSFQAPLVSGPEGKAFRDGDSVKFEFTSVGHLAPDQCYRFDMTLGNPTGPGGVGDYWIGLCGDQSNPGDHLAFDLKPGRFRTEANYGTLLVSADSVIPPTPQYTMQWFVTVVKMVDNTDTVHPKVESISPASASLQNSFFR